MARAETEIRLLGRVDAQVHGRPVDIPSLKQRALLALLALETGRTVTVDQLIDGVWGDLPPQTVTVGLRVHISQLRKVFEACGAAPMIATRPGGYALDAARTAVDVHRFAAAARAARDAVATGLRTGYESPERR